MILFTFSLQSALTDKAKEATVRQTGGSLWGEVKTRRQNRRCKTQNVDMNM